MHGMLRTSRLLLLPDEFLFVMNFGAVVPIHHYKPTAMCPYCEITVLDLLGISCGACLQALGSGIWPVMVLLSEVVQTFILADFWSVPPSSWPEFQQFLPSFENFL